MALFQYFPENSSKLSPEYPVSITFQQNKNFSEHTPAMQISWQHFSMPKSEEITLFLKTEKINVYSEEHIVSRLSLSFKR